MNVPECVDRLTEGSAGNEIENPLLFFPGRRKRWRRRRKLRNSATPFSLLKRQEGGGEKDFWKRETYSIQGQTKTEWWWWWWWGDQ